MMLGDCGTWITDGSSVTRPPLDWLQAGVDVRQHQSAEGPE